MGQYFYSTQVETHHANENYNKASHREIKNAFKKLGSWREKSQKELSFISKSINNGINDLIEEVRDMEAELVATKKEKNDLIQTVSNLSSEIRKLSAELAVTQSLPIPDPEDIHNQDATKEEFLERELPDTDQQ